MMLRRNVLIFHQAALGDFILTWPTALALARIFPQSRIVYVTAAEKGALAESALRVDSTDVEGGWHRLFEPGIRLVQLSPAVQKLLGATHTALVFAASLPDLLDEALSRIVPDVRRITLSAAPKWGVHLADAYVQQLSEWPAFGEASRQILAGIRSRGIAVGRKPSIDVLIHPGSGGQGKRWPLDCFVDLAKAILASGRSCRFVLGEVERERFTSAERTLLEQTTEVVMPGKAVALFNAMLTCRQYVGNDSGPTHLAAITGTPTVAIFGPSDPVIWSPIGPGVSVIRGESIESITADSVYAALR